MTCLYIWNDQSCHFSAFHATPATCESHPRKKTRRNRLKTRTRDCALPVLSDLVKKRLRDYLLNSKLWPCGCTSTFYNKTEHHYMLNIYPQIPKHKYRTWDPWNRQMKSRKMRSLTPCPCLFSWKNPFHFSPLQSPQKIWCGPNVQKENPTWVMKCCELLSGLWLFQNLKDGPKWPRFQFIVSR